MRMKVNPTIRICVLQHFPCELPPCFADREIYVPIQCGRAGKDAIPGTTGDDTGDNISTRNADVNEMTAIYWVAKHYAEIGNPDYIGFDHYRRFLEWDYGMLGKNTVIAHRWFSWRVLRKQYAYCHRSEHLDLFISRLKEKLSVSEHAEFDAYWQEHFLYLANCFIMDRESFFRYFSFIESCLNVTFSMSDTNAIDRSGYNPSEKRVYSFILERMTGYWIWRERRRKTIRVRHAKMIHYDIENNENGTRRAHVNPFSYFWQPQ